MYSDLEKELQVELLTLGNISELLYVVETLKIFFLIVFFFLTISFHLKNNEVLGLVFFFLFFLEAYLEGMGSRKPLE